MTNKERRLSLVSLTGRPTACGTRQKSDPAQKPFEISDEALAQLRDDVMLRRVEQGGKWFEVPGRTLEALNPGHRNAAPFIGYLSQWVGLSEQAADTVRELLTLFPASARRELALGSYAHLRLADGVLNLNAGEPEMAAAHFDFVISLQQEPIEPELAALAHFWKAVSERKCGHWDSALTHAERARALTLETGHAPVAAMMQAFEARLHVHKGKLARAMELLREADAVLQQTDDFLWLGNIQSAYGSVALDEGRYELALEHFRKAIAYYQKRNPQHRNLARSLIRLAHSQRLIAVRRAKAIDTRAELRRKSAKSESPAPTDAAARQDVEQLRGEAFANLAEAIDLCSSSGETGGLALASIERGFLLVDCGHFDRAALEAHAAFEQGSRINNHTVMAYARLLLSRIESAEYDEGVGDTPAQHAQRAHDFAKDALTYARQTENRRLLASAYLCQGLAFCNEFFGNPEAAGECCRQAGQFLTPGNCNQLWEEHQTLARKVARTGNVDSRLRAWSQGWVGGKTFQQMTEEFAEVVIPRVWEREGRNVSRVVAKLSISPKKVRRILGRAGLKAI